MSMQNLDLEAIKFWIDILWKLGTVAGIAWLALRQHSRANARRLDRHQEILDEHGDELIRITEQLKGHPTHGDLEKLHDRISKGNDSLAATREEVSALITEVKGLRTGIDRLNDFLLKGGGR